MHFVNRKEKQNNSYINNQGFTVREVTEETNSGEKIFLCGFCEDEMSKESKIGIQN